MPIAVEAVRALTTSAGLWYWGDQALIDIEAGNSLVGRNLLGVYDRYGWHHPGPLWLLLLGLARWVGGGSQVALELGFFLLQGAAAAAIVLVAHRLRPGWAMWLVALALVGYEWSVGLERLGTVWAPYAIGLPAALLVLLVGGMATSANPWPWAIGGAVCATFLVQTDVGTGVLVAVLVVAAPGLRWLGRPPAPPAVVTNGPVPRGGRGRRSWSLPPGRWRRGVPSLAGVVALLWLPPLVQQFTATTGNLTAVAQFVTSHPAHHSWGSALQAADTILGSFPFRFDVPTGTHDANPAWLLAHSIVSHPFFLLYALVTLAACAFAGARRQRQLSVMALTALVALLAALWSVHLVYGQLFPYLVFWTGALVLPALAVWVLVVASIGTGRARAGGRPARSALRGWVRLSARAGLSAGGLIGALLVSVAYAVRPVPMTGSSSRLGHHAWEAVAAEVSSPSVRTVYVDIAGADAMPEAAAIADEVVRHGRRLELDRKALFYLDPSFAPTARAQLEVVVCCGRGDRGRPPPSVLWRAEVGKQNIYVSRPAFSRL